MPKKVYRHCQFKGLIAQGKIERKKAE